MQCCVYSTDFDLVVQTLAPEEEEQGWGHEQNDVYKYISSLCCKMNGPIIDMFSK